MRNLRSAALILLSLAVGLVSAGWGAPAASAASITWPDLVVINPTITPYRVVVTGATGTYFRATWQLESETTAPSVRIEAASPLDLTPALTERFGRGRLTLDECTENGSCTLIGTSGVIETVGMTVAPLPVVDHSVINVAPTVRAELTITPSVMTNLVVDWQVEPLWFGPITASGTTPLTAGPNGVLFAPALPALPDGRQALRILRVRGDHPLYGAMSARVLGAWEFTLDTTKPVLQVAPVKDIYPWPDRHLDSTSITVKHLAQPANPSIPQGSWDSMADLIKGPYTIDIVDAGGGVVRTISAPNSTYSVTTVWDGRDNRGAIVPAGVYAVRAQAADGAGNVGTATGSVTVRAERLVHRRPSATASAPTSPPVGAGSGASRSVASRW